MAKHFRVIAGSHKEDDGKIYRKGEVFQSEHPLDEMFANKFAEATESEVKTFKAAKAQKKGKPPGSVPNIEDVEADTANARAAREYREKVEKGEIDEDEEAQAEEEDGDVVSTLGNDVSDDFEGADKVGVKVFKKGKTYSVAKEDSPGKAVRNGKDLTRGQVKAYIEEHTPEEPVSDEE